MLQIQNISPKIWNNTENIEALRYVDIPDRDWIIQEEKLDKRKNAETNTKIISANKSQLSILYGFISFLSGVCVCRKKIRAKHVIIKRIVNETCI